MNIKQLKERIENLSDDTLVVVEGPDHNYFNAFCYGPDRAINEVTNLSEYYETDIYGKVEILVIGM